MAHARPAGRRISLGLQGGGSFGAFTWGVLDRLLEQDELDYDLASGASAGAVNAVLLAEGLAEGEHDAAREKLERFWKRVSHASPFAASGFSHFAAQSVAAATMELVRVVSPYQFNPLGLNPLRELLADEIDFDRLRAAPPIRLLIAATRVSDGRPRLFTETELTLDHVLASACLPFLQQAVEIDGEAYWDGGYSANPPLRQLVIDTEAEEIVVVQLLPEQQPGPPHLSHEIARREREIGFNASFLREQELVADLRRACAGPRLLRSPLCRKLARLKCHRIVADAIADLGHESAMDTSWPFLLRLKESGRAAAEDWLHTP